MRPLEVLDFPTTTPKKENSEIRTNKDPNLLNMMCQEIATSIIFSLFLNTKVSQNYNPKDMSVIADNYPIQASTLKQLLAAVTTQLEKETVEDPNYKVNIEQVVELSSLPNNTSVMTDESLMLQSVSLLKQVFKFIENNYYRPISIGDVAQAVGYSPAYLTNLVRQQTGQSLYRWIIHRRMLQAYFLLLETDKTMNEIAINLGYQNVNSFCRQFRKITGKSPKEWKSICRLNFDLAKRHTKELITLSKDWFLYHTPHTL